MTERHRKFLAGLAIAVFILLSAVVAWFVGRPLIHHLHDPEAFRLWIDSHGWAGRLIFVGISVLQIVVAIIPGEPIELFAGYAFGFWLGTLLCELGALTPPVGINLFIIQSSAEGLTTNKIFKGCVPIIIIMLLVTILIWVFPGLCTFMFS